MKLRRFAVALYAVLLLLAAFPTRAMALGMGRYHPPCITLLVYHAPKGLEASIEMEKNEERFPVTMQKETRLWETQFRLYREGAYRMRSWFGNEKDFKNAVLILHTASGDVQVPIPADQLTHGGSEDVISYDFRTGELKVGMPAGRIPMLFAARMLILLLLKGLILFFFGYRRLSSWLGFLAVNLISMGVVNLFTKGWINVDMANAYPLLFVGMLVLLLFEIISLVVVLGEFNRNKAVSYAVGANLAGAVTIFLMLTYFPY